MTLCDPEADLLVLLTMHGLRQLPLHITGILGNEDIVNAYFLISGGEALLVDTGRDPEVDGAAILEFWRELGEPTMLGIVLTHAHPDHVGAAAVLREAWRVPVSMHEAEITLLERGGSQFRPDRFLTDNEELETPLGTATVLHTPGHSPGHVCLYFEGSGLLLSGDQVLTNGTVYVGEPFGDMTLYLESMRRLLSLPIETLAPGHGPVISSGWRRVLEMHEYRLRREGEIIMALRQEPQSALDIARLLYSGRDVPEEVLEFGARQTECHLVHLERAGVVRRDGDGGCWAVSR